MNYTLDRNNISKGAVEQIPTDKPYVCKIISAKGMHYDEAQKKMVETPTDKQPQKLVIAFDITEGDYTGYYKKRFSKDTSEDKKWKGVIRINVPKSDGSEQDGWTIRRFNTTLVNIEESNPGYLWDNDLSKLKDKLIGMVYRNKEWEMNGNTGWFSEPYSIIKVEDARAGKFRKPQDKPLDKKNTAPALASTEFVPIPENIDEEIPFE